MKKVNFHDYLGMNIYYSEKGTVNVSMIKYVKKHMGALTEDINSNSNSIASDHLFQIREESKAVVLPEEKAVEFHHTVAQIFLCQKGI